MTSKTQKILVAVPKSFSLAPIFAACPQTQPRDVTVGDFRYTIGGFHPVHRTRVTPALDVRHTRALLTLLKFRDPFDSTRLIRFSMNEFCRTYARSQGGRYARDIADLLGDLMDTYFRIEQLSTGVADSYRILERIHVQERPIRRKDDRRVGSTQTEMWLESATISPEFAAILDRIEELGHVRLDVLTSIRSPLAQAIYLYIPSRAAHHTEASPFEITLTRLLEQVSHPVPEYKSERKKLFSQHRTSILSQLDGKETLSGVFHARLAETADGNDWKLQCWVEKPNYTSSAPSAPASKLVDSKMVRAFLQTGKTMEDVRRSIDRMQPFTAYEEELLELGKIDLNGSRRAFELAKALLGEFRFDQLLAEAKGEVLERRNPTKSPNHRLMSRLMEALRQG